MVGKGVCFDYGRWFAQRLSALEEESFISSLFSSLYSIQEIEESKSNSQRFPQLPLQNAQIFVNIFIQ